MFRKGRELEVGIEAPREFGSGIGGLERDVDFDIALQNKGTAVRFTLLLSSNSTGLCRDKSPQMESDRKCPITCFKVMFGKGLV